jgi:hypothetical protein
LVQILPESGFALDPDPHIPNADPKHWLQEGSSDSQEHLEMLEGIAAGR